MTLFLHVYHFITTCVKHPEPDSVSLIQLQSCNSSGPVPVLVLPTPPMGKKVIVADVDMPLDAICRWAKWVIRVIISTHVPPVSHEHYSIKTAVLFSSHAQLQGWQCWSVSLPLSNETSLQLLDVSPWNLVQMFVFPSGLVVIAFVIDRLFVLHHF